MKPFKIKKIAGALPHQTSSWTAKKLGKNVTVQGAQVFPEIKNKGEFQERMRSAPRDPNMSEYERWYSTHTPEEKKALEDTWAKPVRYAAPHKKGLASRVEADVVRLKRAGF
jgi:hypothetical protein